jgi:hypothetical protein
MSGFPVVSLDKKIDFLESVVIPSFDEDLGLKTSKERKDWMKVKAEKYVTKEEADELMDRFSTIYTLEKAEFKLSEAKQERQQQLSAAGKFVWRFYLTSFYNSFYK